MKLRLSPTLAEDRIRALCHYLHLTVDKLTLQIDPAADGLTIEGEEGTYTFNASKTPLIYRGLLLLASELQAGHHTIQLHERPDFDELGFMADVSRNAVLTVDSCRKLLRLLALMGYSNFQLYMEDTYQMADYPYFGYFRGAYSIEELQAIEREANAYGLDFIPCIQTLAHLSAYLKWQTASVQAVHDIDDILLIDEPATYHLIDSMFKTLSALKTRRINIGMDEAHRVGLGRYLDQHGYHNRTLLMCRHLERVLDIADKYGFTCSMWSDMFFQLLTGQKHYTGALTIDAETKAALEGLKKRVTLIYWDYYQTEEETYRQKMANHAPLGEQIAFAGGVWKWLGYTPDNHFSMTIAEAAYQACRKQGIQEVTVTAWGDNGGESSIFSVLPGIQAWAEFANRGHLDNLGKRFQTLHKLTLDDFLRIDLANRIPSHPPNTHSLNPHRYLLYQDVLCPLLDRHSDPEKDGQHFQSAVTQLRTVAEKAGEWQYLFETQAKLCQVLAQKTTISHELRRAYQTHDLETLRAMPSRLMALQTAVKAFHHTYSRQWLQENKIFGLDTIDLRLGGLHARIERAKERIDDYLTGKVSRLEELEVTILPFNDYAFDSDHPATSANLWHFIATASTLDTN